jgi:hypothetical protein
MSIQYAGGTIVKTTFTSTTKAALQGSVISNLVTAGWSQATGPSGGGAQTVTVTIASPGVVSLASHGLLANDSVVFATTGALPTGLTAGTRYFVKTVLTSGTFTVSTTSGGTAINTTGSQSGVQTMVGTVRMATATTAWGITARVNLQDNGGSCITFSIENSNSSLAGLNTTTRGCFLVPGATAFNIIANKYQFFVFTSISTLSRCFVCGGTPYIPTFLQSVMTECGWVGCNSVTDTDVLLRSGFRTNMFTIGNPGSNSQAIANGNLIDLGNTSSATGSLAILTFDALGAGTFPAAVTGFHWTDASAFMIEPLVAWSNTSSTGEPLMRGQLWDAILIADTFDGDTTTTFDGHDWWAMTDGNTGGKVTLFIATT